MVDFNVYKFSMTGTENNVEEVVELVIQAQKGNEVAFGQLYDLYFQKIYRFIFYRTGHKQTAEDLTEEVFIKAHAKISTLSEPKVFKGWLYQIARNGIIDYYREKKLTVDLQDVENTLEYETNIVDIVNLQYQQAVLLKLLKELGAEQQAVIKMKFLEDLDNGEIAQLLGKSEGAIRVIQHRALNKLLELKKMLDEDNE
jgi:RNA polymerase sigma-70 factor, ECF subfamily